MGNGSERVSLFRVVSVAAEGVRLIPMEDEERAKVDNVHPSESSQISLSLSDYADYALHQRVPEAGRNVRASAICRWLRSVRLMPWCTADVCPAGRDQSKGRWEALA